MDKPMHRRPLLQVFRGLWCLSRYNKYNPVLGTFAGGKKDLSNRLTADQC